MDSGTAKRIKSPWENIKTFQFCDKNGLERCQPDEEGVWEINHQDLHVALREFLELDMLLIDASVGDSPAEGLGDLAILMHTEGQSPL